MSKGFPIGQPIDIYFHVITQTLTVVCKMDRKEGFHGGYSGWFYGNPMNPWAKPSTLNCPDVCMDWIQPLFVAGE